MLSVWGNGGIGIYFDTNKPLIHIDSRKGRLMWLCYKEEDGERVYLYRENDAVKFYKKLELYQKNIWYNFGDAEIKFWSTTPEELEYFLMFVP